MTRDMNVPGLSRQPSDRLVRDFFIFYSATLVFFAIGIITTLGLGWYGGISTPSWTSPELVIAVIWGALFVTTVISLSIICDVQAKPAKEFRRTVLLYMGNALLILLWNYLFFGVHFLVLALGTAIVIGLSVLVLIFRVKDISRAAAWLLVPYLLWMIYAIAINYAVMMMN